MASFGRNTLAAVQTFRNSVILEAAHTAPAKSSDKRITPALFMLFFLGPFGLHQFYAGNIGRGIAYLACFALGSFAQSLSEEAAFAGQLLFFLMGIGLIVDTGLLCLRKFKDSQGRPLTRWS